jgi:hypothetical protein
MSFLRRLDEKVIGRQPLADSARLRQLPLNHPERLAASRRGARINLVVGLVALVLGLILWAFFGLKCALGPLAAGGGFVLGSSALLLAARRSAR